MSIFSFASPLNPGSGNISRVGFIETILQMGRLAPGGSVDLPMVPWDVGTEPALDPWCDSEPGAGEDLTGGERL